MICNKSKIKTKETGKNMKKIAIVILLLLTLCLCGCERNEGEIMENDPFYSLQKIYNDKLLTRDELRKINRKYYEETDFDLKIDEIHPTLDYTSHQFLIKQAIIL